MSYRGLLLVSAVVWAGLVGLRPTETSGAFGNGVTPGEDDTTGAVLRTQHRAGSIRIDGLFSSSTHSGDTLTYRLRVRREGVAGSSQSVQSGTFVRAAGYVDTLATVRVNVRSGDALQARLAVRDDARRIDTARLEHTVP